ncbi:DNA circularization N-terminal domain-containing protein [Gluconobacter sp. LMG 31484]|uniref:DNA circularization N-terminal domain-containing protein n=1 Tax=Gluconobacter vitians TaxID=2728102 RepID=A0ABR9Y753_9PROT|nr:DNA circularization N-terminal domain-containing protein [Gluconobacter vitians]MBF0859423.1 DNA circularization N-terminal domain-containing protein [Gluconobacter vitians]
MSGTLARTAAEYLQCSFRGVPFAVMGNGGSSGRKQAEHGYPGRSGVWVEDIGKKARRYRILGFVSGDLAYVQRDALVIASEQAGSGLLVHPSIGAIKAACTRFEWRERDGRLNVVDLEFEFVEQKNLLSTLIVTALHAAVAVARIALSSASSSSYSSRTSSAFATGGSAIAAARSVAAGWGDGAVLAIGSSEAMQSAASVLPGNNGRYASGAGAETDATATEDSVLAALSASRASIDEDAATIIGLTTAAEISSAVQALTEALREAIADPGVQISLLWPLASCSVDVINSAAPIGAALATAQTETAALCRRAALASIAQACSDWRPPSSEEAEAMCGRVVALFEAEELVAADAQDDTSWAALKALKVQVSQDLMKRAAKLPDIVTIERNAPLPALTLAQQLYADGTRSDGLVSRANPVHPAFMPTEFEALSS